MLNTIATVLMATIPLFNPMQQSNTLMLWDNVQPWQYKIKLHANTTVKSAETNLWNCNVQWQDALCNITIKADTTPKSIVSTVILEKRPDEKYILDYSNTDDALRPAVAGWIVKYPSTENATTVSTQNTEGTVKNTKNVNQKKTWLSMSVIMLLLTIMIVGILLFRKEDNK